MTNINEIVRNLQIKLHKNDYWDFRLSKYIVATDNNNNNIDDLISYIDICDDRCYENDAIYSKPEFIWDGSINNDVILRNIGFTGIDNGLISYRKDKITNLQFLDILTKSEYYMPHGDYRLFLNKVTGNTLNFIYPSEVIKKDECYLKLNGGFYQGFFKIYDKDYQVLPCKIENDWHFEFKVRKRDYEVQPNTLNFINPNNKGIFFYIGTRAENKFWEFYNVNKNQFEKSHHNKYNDDGYFKEDIFNKSKDITTSDYFVLEGDPTTPPKKEDPPYIKHPLDIDYGYAVDGVIVWDTLCPNDCGKVTPPPIPPKPKPINKENYWLNYYDYNYNNNCLCNCTHKLPKPDKPCDCNDKDKDKDEVEGTCVDCLSYFADDYYRGYPCNISYCESDSYLGEIDYYKPDVDIEGSIFDTYEGFQIKECGYKVIDTNNKYLLFNHTKDGFTTKNWIEDYYSLIGKKSSFKGNLFTLMDYTSKGYTTKTIGGYLSQFENNYNVLQDIYNNALAFTINDNGEIGYKYLIKDCNTNTYKIESEYSNPLIQKDEWYVINTRIEIFGNDYMKIHFYVNGKLKFISKTLPKIKFKPLNDIADKQEAVPYNISLGGGTQGLLERIWVNYYDMSDYILPLEKNFAGTFMGDIKEFKIYNNRINFKTINNNSLYND